MRRLIKHLGIIHNDLAGSCLDLIINLVTTSENGERQWKRVKKVAKRRVNQTERLQMSE